MTWKAETSSPPTPGVALGPAVVEEAAGEKIRLRTADGSCWATWAVAFPYRVQPGDVVLRIGEAPCYVIGVLKGSGTTSFSAPADLELRAPNGRVDVIAARGVRLRGPRVQIGARTIELVGGRLRERFESVERRITGRLRERIGSVRTRVEDTWGLLAGRVRQRARGRVQIDGEKIDLG